MPIVDGLEATRMIRALERRDIMATTSSADTDDESFVTAGWRRTPYPAGTPESELENQFNMLQYRLRTKSFTEPCFPSGRSSDTSLPEGAFFSPQSRRESRRASIVKSSSSGTSLPTSLFFPHQTQHVPIFAVSANLNQHSQESLEAAGFDGWLPKPIDFARLGILLKGATCNLWRERGRYKPEEPRAGGWF
jgi:CheY-like chemotaxis protein